MVTLMGNNCRGDPAYYSELVRENGDHDLFKSAEEALASYASLATCIRDSALCNGGDRFDGRREARPRRR